MSKHELEEVLKAMQMLHERLLRVETWMLNQDAKGTENENEKSV
jgi:hypothetical protein